jgi:hypothetical protein
MSGVAGGKRQVWSSKVAGCEGSAFASYFILLSGV